VLEHPGGANADKASITKVASDESLQLQASLGASNKSIVFLVGNNNEVARFDAGKELLIGTSTALSNVSISGGTTTPSVQIEGNSGSTSSLCITRTSNTGAANLMLQCGATATPVTADDKVGQINFSGFDGTNYRNTAQIASEVDGTPGTDDMPGRLIFSTTPSGSFSPTERMRIDSSGRLGLGTSSPSELLQVDGGNLLVRNNSGNNITLSTNVGNKNDSTFIFQKARGGSSGPTQIVADDNLGTIEWQGYDGSSYNEAAKIISRARTNTGNFDADLIYDANGHNFKNNGSSSVFIDSSGRLLIGTIASPAYQLQVSTDSAGKPSTNTWTIVSDERIKEDIELADLDICYEAVKNIPLKRFKWKDEVYTEEQVPDRHKLGWIAQDVESVFPKAVCIHEFKYNQVFEETVIPAVEEELDEDGNVITPAQPERVEKGELISEDVIEDCRDLNADQLYAAMYGAIQKLIAKVETLEAKVATLENV
jgi:hypothetical protein